MALFDGYDFCHLCIPWKAGVGGLISLTAGVEDFRIHALYDKIEVRFYYSVHCVLGGKGHMTFRGREYEVKAGDMFCIPPRERVRYVADSDDPWYYCWFNFAGEQAQSYATSLGFGSNLPLIRPVNDLKGVEKIFEDLIGNQPVIDIPTPKMEKAPYTYKMLAAFFSFMNQESYEVFLDKSMFEGRRAPFLEKYIQDHYNDADFSVSDSYLPFHMTTSLREDFTRRYNMSPLKYLTSVRMEHAIALLSTENKRITITEIANLCGYKNPYYFMKLFKKIYGMTAAQYRKKYNNNIR